MLTMRKLILILALTATVGAQTVERSALFYGEYEGKTAAAGDDSLMVYDPGVASQLRIAWAQRKPLQ